MLRSKGILPPKKEAEITEEQLLQMVEETIEEKSNKSKGNTEAAGGWFPHLKINWQQYSSLDKFCMNIVIKFHNLVYLALVFTCLVEMFLREGSRRLELG